MFKKTYLTSILLIAMLILGACGNSTQEDNPTGTNPNEQESTEDLENDENTENDVEEDNAEEIEADIEEDEETTDQNNTEKNTETEDNEDSTEDNENAEDTGDFQAKAERVDSDAQDFSIQILPAYTLTSEEPGRDSLFLTDDGNIFMRIETTPFDQETYDYFKENTVSLLESTKADGETVTETTTLPQSEDIKNSIGYTVPTNESVLTGIVFEKDDLLVRLTIFDTLEEEHYNDFIQMGETIMNK